MMMSLASIYVLWRISILPKPYCLEKSAAYFCMDRDSSELSIYELRSAIVLWQFIKPVNIDGTVWLKTQSPDIYDIVQFFETKIDGQPIILEVRREL